MFYMHHLSIKIYPIGVLQILIQSQLNLVPILHYLESNKPVWGTCPSTTAIPDANFEQALIDLGYDSGEIDGHVLTANISDVTSLIVNNKNIESLTGIEDFTALTLLWCFNNQITSLDLSANTALNTLYCYTNQLTSLDLSANPTLEYLTCYDNHINKFRY